MCGINGFTWDDRTLLCRMNEALRHRGPDDSGTYTDGRVSLGHQRLSIIDLTPAGHQPMSNEDGGVWIVYNGEIYNYKEIRPDLEAAGHRFRSETDTEVILHAYEEWGADCVERFNGMWAFAIYDIAKGLLFLSRDRFGVKPLYYHLGDRDLIFSSEIKGLLQHDLERAPNDRAIYEYLAYGIMEHCPETFFSGILRLMPGESMIYDLARRTAQKSQWYDLEGRIEALKEEIGGLSEDEAAGRVRSLFEDSIRYRLISDVPVGSCLSGGIDSSCIVYTMRRLGTNERLKAFSMVFPGQRMDESTYIDEVVRDTAVQSFTTTPTTGDLMNDLLDLIRTQEEPFRSTSIYGQYRVMRLAHENGMKVLLDGQGADELFAGYRIYFKYYIFEALSSLHLGEAMSCAAAVNYSLSDLLLFPAATIATRLGLGDIFRWAWNRRLRHLLPFYKRQSVNLLQERGFSLNRALLTDLIRYSIPQLLRYEDKNAMRWSIESRVPFLDFRLVEMACALPSAFKIHKGVTKQILRRAMSGIVSERILRRRDKIGFATPDEDWLSAPEFSSLMKEMLGSEKFRGRPYWRHMEVARIFEEHRSGRRGKSEDLWRIINTELWLQAFIESEGTEGAFASPDPDRSTR